MISKNSSSKIKVYEITGSIEDVIIFYEVISSISPQKAFEVAEKSIKSIYEKKGKDLIIQIDELQLLKSDPGFNYGENKFIVLFKYPIMNILKITRGKFILTKKKFEI